MEQSLMENSTKTSQESSRKVQEAVQHVLASNSVRSAVIEHEGATLLVTKGRRLGVALEPAETPPADYPVVRTTLKDDADSWLR